MGSILSPSYFPRVGKARSFRVPNQTPILYFDFMHDSDLEPFTNFGGYTVGDQLLVAAIANMSCVITAERMVRRPIRIETRMYRTVTMWYHGLFFGYLDNFYWFGHDGIPTTTALRRSTNPANITGSIVEVIGAFAHGIPINEWARVIMEMDTANITCTVTRESTGVSWSGTFAHTTLMEGYVGIMIQPNPTTYFDWLLATKP